MSKEELALALHGALKGHAFNDPLIHDVRLKDNKLVIITDKNTNKLKTQAWLVNIEELLILQNYIPNENA
jgi:hypothetical protein